MKIGLALGSGSARGWSHIGVIKALAEEGIEVDVITGCSIGALVGAAHASGQLDKLEEWVVKLRFWDVVRLMDVRMDGGLIEGESLMLSLSDKVRQTDIRNLSLPYAAVATDLVNGREVWLQEGELSDVVRASIALPGLFSPYRLNDRWLVDGGLTNPVPVSLCRAMGAEVIIAVNLNSDIIGRHNRKAKRTPDDTDNGTRNLLNQLLEKMNKGVVERTLSKLPGNQPAKEKIPGMLEVMASAIHIMQDRITKSRMAGDPPDVLISPRLGKVGLLEFDRAEEAIAEGYESVRRMLPVLHDAMGH